MIFRIYLVELESCKAIYKISKLSILAWGKYTRSNPDLNPPTIVSDPHKIGQKSKKVAEKFSVAEEQSSDVFIPCVHSHVERLDTLQDVEFDVHFEKSLFCSKSLSCIDQIVVDSSISFEYTIEYFFTQSKSGSHLIHALDQL